MNNKSLYWYGLKAQIKEGFGKFVLVIGVFFGFIAMLSSPTLGFIIIIAGIVIGVIIIFKSKAQRFDYQRQSGNIIHRGDW